MCCCVSDYGRRSPQSREAIAFCISAREIEDEMHHAGYWHCPTGTLTSSSIFPSSCSVSSTDVIVPHFIALIRPRQLYLGCIPGLGLTLFAPTVPVIIWVTSTVTWCLFADVSLAILPIAPPSFVETATARGDRYMHGLQGGGYCPSLETLIVCLFLGPFVRCSRAHLRPVPRA